MVWQLRYRNTVGSWSSFTNIPAPNNDISINRMSTQSRESLVDGSVVRLQPSTKYNIEPTEISWSFISAASSLLTPVAGNTTLTSAVINGYGLQFKTHNLYTNTPQYWYGYIINMPQIYKLGMYPNASGVSETFYDISINFDLISITATSGNP